jgi:uncharacterized OB-fold protein
MNCKNCGAPLDPGQNICVYCGSYNLTSSEHSHLHMDADSITMLSTMMTPNEIRELCINVTAFETKISFRSVDR